MVQNAFVPSTRQPASVRVAVVRGRVRSWPISLIAVAMITPSRAIVASESPNALARRASPAVSAAFRRPMRFSTTTRCMFTPMATDASPRASRPDATTTSCTEVTPRPPCWTGIGATKYPARLSASIPA
jgi:hypothetical protein